MKKMIESLKKILAAMNRTHKETAPYVRNVLYDTRAIQSIAM